jgi:hypothetical protein
MGQPRVDSSARHRNSQDERLVAGPGRKRPKNHQGTLSMKKTLAGLLTVTLMGFVTWAGLRGNFERTRDLSAGVGATDTPEGRVQALLQSARVGDDGAYLASFDEPMRARITRRIEEQGRDAFVAALRQAVRSRKSHAVFAAAPEGDAASVVVEMVYADHNETQTYQLSRSSDAWLVTNVTTARGQLPPSRFGATASFQDPEGLPVNGPTFADDIAAPRP